MPFASQTWLGKARNKMEVVEKHRKNMGGILQASMFDSQRVNGQNIIVTMKTIIILAGIWVSSIMR